MGFSGGGFELRMVGLFGIFVGFSSGFFVFVGEEYREKKEIRKCLNLSISLISFKN